MNSIQKLIAEKQGLSEFMGWYEFYGEGGFKLISTRMTYFSLYYNALDEL